jgi:Domain of unknown function (DUF4886)/PKD domain
MKIAYFLIAFFMLTAQQTSAQEETSVLFIGNSYTFQNDMPDIFKKIAASFDRAVYVDTVVMGGKNLKYHAAQAITYETIRKRKWDFVVIQGHSDEFAQPDEVANKNTFPAVRQLMDSVKANHPCSQVLFYMTWAYESGNPNWDKINTYQKMQDMVAAGYQRMSNEFNIPLSPVGLVWQAVRKTDSSINLYHEDLKHPSLAGSYLSACTFFTSIFGISPQYNSSMIALPESQKKTIEATASSIVLNNLAKFRLLPPRPKLEAGFDIILQNNQLDLVNRAILYDTVEWDFGDGTSSNEENPSHVYERMDVYDIQQTVSNGCETKTLTRLIQVRSIE